MSILVWNCHGLGGSGAVRHLVELVRFHNPSLVFLSETKCKKKSFDRLKIRLNFHGICVESVGIGGGLGLLWNKSLDVSLQSFSSSHIDAKVYMSNKADCWRFTGFYGNHITAERKNSWRLLEKLSRWGCSKWLIAGDFNEILLPDEKSGHRVRPLWQMRNFREAIDQADLHDLGFFGPKFTWSNYWKEPDTVRLRIDRAFGNQEWINSFPNTKVTHLPTSASDHCVLHILLDPPAQSPQPKRKRLFRFEAAWLRSSDCEKVIRDSWKSNPTLDETNLTWDNIKNCRMGLLNWNKSDPSCVSKRSKELEAQLIILREGQITTESRSMEALVRAELDEIRACEETLWLQRSRALWMRDGDQNTKFFHHCASERKRRNEILKLRDEVGDWHSDKIVIQDIIVRYFNQIFSSVHPSESVIDEAILNVNPRVTEEMNRILDRDFTAEDVAFSLSQMHPLKSPGPDGTQFGFIVPQRGIRQGDPLSPYLFLFVAEIFSCLIQDAEKRGILKGVSVSKFAPRVSHLLFADDTVIFMQATEEAFCGLQQILSTFEAISGQQVNFDKSSMVFSKNTRSDEGALLAAMLGIKVVDKHDKYLGLPSIVGRSRREVFASIRDRVIARFQSWNAKFLSQAGKEIFLKAVIQSIPTFAMACFKLPDSFLREIESAMANFWWHNRETKKTHWIAWDKLCCDKSEGGVGFRALKDFNLAMLAKQGWRILQNPDSLLARVLRAKYFYRTSFFEANIGANPSFTWRSIFSAQDILFEGIRWRVGNGTSLRVWTSRWLPRPDDFCVRTFPNTIPMDARVACLIDSRTGWWDPHLLEEIFDPDDAEIIKRIPIGPIDSKDCIVWHYTKSGIFSVRSAYRLIRDIRNRFAPSSSSNVFVANPPNEWDFIWRAKVPPKVKFFGWRACLNALPSGVNLIKRRVVEYSPCPLCSSEEEDMGHTLFLCSFARLVWALSNIPWRSLSGWRNDIRSWFRELHLALDPAEYHLFLVICWFLWYNRNVSLMDNSALNPGSLVLAARSLLNAFSLAHPFGSVFRGVPSGDCWIPPPVGVVKVNFDGAFSVSLGCMGVGVVCRDSSGSCLAWFGRRFAFLTSPEHSEALAVLKAVRLAVRLGWSNVVFEGDCINVINILKSGARNLSDCGAVCSEVYSLSSCFSSVSFAFSRRLSNVVAHCIARDALVNSEPVLELPASALDALLFDSNSI